MQPGDIAAQIEAASTKRSTYRVVSVEPSHVEAGWIVWLEDEPGAQSSIVKHMDHVGFMLRGYGRRLGRGWYLHVQEWRVHEKTAGAVSR